MGMLGLHEGGGRSPIQMWSCHSKGTGGFPPLFNKGPSQQSLCSSPEPGQVAGFGVGVPLPPFPVPRLEKASAERLDCP